MFSKLKNYFFKLPGIRGWKHKRDQRNIKRGIDTLNGLKNLINYQTYSDNDLKEACEVLTELTISPYRIVRLRQLRFETFYSVSTQKALNFIDRKYFTKADINQYKGVNINPERKPINCWLSSEESIQCFIDVMSTVLKNTTKVENPTSKISALEAEFADSMLFRLLLSDFATLVALILEIDYETNERKIQPDPLRTAY